VIRDNVNNQIKFTNPYMQLFHKYPGWGSMGLYDMILADPYDKTFLGPYKLYFDLDVKI